LGTKGWKNTAVPRNERIAFKSLGISKVRIESNFAELLKTKSNAVKTNASEEFKKQIGNIP
jgi:hypothetical protein